MATEVNTETGEVTETTELDATPTPTPDVPEPTPEPEEPPITEEDAREGAEEPAPPEPEASAVQSQKEIEAQVKKLERASETYTKKVAEILGDQLTDFVATPFSEPFLFGFVWNPEIRPLDESIINAARAMIGEPIHRPLKQAPDSRTCPVCDGEGRVETGSHVHPYNVDKCRECNGRGAVGERYNLTAEQVASGVTLVAASNGHDEEPPALEDSWGTPIGHPDYGKMPQYRNPGWAEALDAYKRGEPAPVV